MKKVSLLLLVFSAAWSCTNKESEISDKTSGSEPAKNIHYKSAASFRSNVSNCRTQPTSVVINFNMGSDGILYITSSEETSNQSDKTKFYALTPNITTQQSGSRYTVTIPNSNNKYWLIPFNNPTGLQRMAAESFSIWCDCLNSDKVSTGGECDVVKTINDGVASWVCSGDFCFLCDMHIDSKIGCGGGILFEANKISLNGQVFE